MVWRVFLLVICLVEAVPLAVGVRLIHCGGDYELKEGETSEFVYISTNRDNCEFLLEGPQGSRLDIELQLISILKSRTDKENCEINGQLSLYNYQDGRVYLDKIFCPDNEGEKLLTSSNVGIVRSHLPDGSFSLRVRPVDTEVHTTNFIDGMSPPRSEARDYFSEARATPIGGFRPLLVPDDFRPSRPLHYYPGRPTAHVDLTVNSTGLNFTVEEFRPTTSSSRPQSSSTATPTSPGAGKPAPTTSVKPSTQSSGHTTAKPTTIKPTTAKPTAIKQTTAKTTTEFIEEE